MTDHSNGGPPGGIWFTLDEALDLLAALEDAWDGLVSAGHLTVVAAIEDQIDGLIRRLGLGPAEGMG